MIPEGNPARQLLRVDHAIRPWEDSNLQSLKCCLHREVHLNDKLECLIHWATGSWQMLVKDMSFVLLLNVVPPPMLLLSANMFVLTHHQQQQALEGQQRAVVSIGGAATRRCLA